MTDPSPNPLYRLREVERSFSPGRFRSRAKIVPALSGVNLDIPRGETVGIVGESGSGKSTLARLLLRLDRPTSGVVEFHLDGTFVDVATMRGRDLAKYRRKVQMVFQDPYTSLNPRHRVRDSFEVALRINHVEAAERESRISDALNVVGLDPDWLLRFPHEFSGGQRQRICIARALVLRPDVIVADEPVSSLDVSVQAQVLNLMRKVQRELGLTYVFIGHDLSIVQYMSDRIVVMNQGQVVEQLKSENLENARDPYTQGLLEAVPDPLIFESGRARREATREGVIHDEKTVL